MLTLEQITKDYENQPLLKGVSFQVQPGETVCLLGRSGSGKSTILRIIAGIETPKSGQVLWQGEEVNHLPPHKRNFGFMFQDYALFPHLNVAENVAFGLKMQKMDGKQIRFQVDQVLDQVNMSAFAKRSVAELSGGEQQRVALARALAPQPRLLMLDEPLGALDRTLKEQLMQELRGLLHQTGIPTIYVTHDQEEAFILGDRLILLREGKIEQNGSPQEIYNNPRNRWVAGFFGFTNLINGVISDARKNTVKTELGDFQIGMESASTFREGEKITMLIRPEGAVVVKQPSPTDNLLSGIVEDCVFLGYGYKVKLAATGNYHFEFLLSDPVAVGNPINLCLNQKQLFCLKG